MTAPAKKHPIPYLTRQLLLQRRDRALSVLNPLKGRVASALDDIERLEWQINAGKKLNPAIIDMHGRAIRAQIEPALWALKGLHNAMRDAYPKAEVIWAAECEGDALNFTEECLREIAREEARHGTQEETQEVAEVVARR